MNVVARAVLWITIYTIVCYLAFLGLVFLDRYAAPLTDRDNVLDLYQDR